jgi:DNA-binding NarL/FixJ family response regulator
MPVMDGIEATAKITATHPDVRVLILTTFDLREREVLGRVALGHTNLEIATALCLSEATVKTHVSRILAKLCLRDHVQAVISATKPDWSARPHRHMQERVRVRNEKIEGIVERTTRRGETGGEFAG